mmetsp:Transcript_1329/g.4471  ORF Transcript_1329/g.4471 Transcript_1329/m.4471 type:complete len:227 (+) Transcript_1329:403-1083(+)
MLSPGPTNEGLLYIPLIRLCDFSFTLLTALSAACPPSTTRPRPCADMAVLKILPAATSRTSSSSAKCISLSRWSGYEKMQRCRSEKVRRASSQSSTANTEAVRVPSWLPSASPLKRAMCPIGCGSFNNAMYLLSLFTTTAEPLKRKNMSSATSSSRMNSSDGTPKNGERHVTSILTNPGEHPLNIGSSVISCLYTCATTSHRKPVGRVPRVLLRSWKPPNTVQLFS